MQTQLSKFAFCQIFSRQLFHPFSPISPTQNPLFANSRIQRILLRKLLHILLIILLIKYIEEYVEENVEEYVEKCQKWVVDVRDMTVGSFTGLMCDWRRRVTYT